MSNQRFMKKQWQLTHLRPRWNRLRRRFDAAYIRVRPGKWAYSKWPAPTVALDFDADDRLIGVEVVGADLKVDAS